MAKSSKSVSTTHSKSHNHAVLIVVSILSLVIVVMVLTRLYLVEKETVTLRQEVSTLLQRTSSQEEPQQVSAPVQGVFDSAYQEMRSQ
ncbi:MAG: hypothetical protein U0525_03070 [Patescibacteria group bacterium]